MRFSTALLVVVLLPALILAEVSPLCFGPECPNVVNALVTGVRGSTVAVGSFLASSLVGPLGASPAVLVSDDLKEWSAAKTVGELPSQLTSVATATDGTLTVVGGPGNDLVPGLLMSANPMGPYEEIVIDDVRYTFNHLRLSGLPSSAISTVFSAVGSRSLPSSAPQNDSSAAGKKVVGSPDSASAWTRRKLSRMSSRPHRLSDQRGETDSFVLIFDAYQSYSVNIPNTKVHGPITGLSTPSETVWYLTRTPVAAEGKTGGVFRTSDGGESYDLVYASPATATVTGVECLRGGLVCLVSASGDPAGPLLRTDDGGNTWGPAGDFAAAVGEEYAVDTVRVSTFGDLIVVGASVKGEDRALVVYSQDGGSSWKSEKLPGRPRRVTAVAVKPNEMGAVVTTTGPDCRGDVTTVYDFVVTK